MGTLRLLIDGDILTYKTCWAVQTEVEWDDGILTTATNVSELEAQANNMIQDWQDKLGDNKTSVSDPRLVICFSDRVNNFRRKIFPDYKLNRKGNKKPLGYNHLEAYLKENYTTHTLPLLEADDVLGILATDGTFNRNIIVSIDKDMLTIPCEYYNMDSEVTEVIDEETANHMFFFQTLVGDPVDNYKGCPGIGPKKATELLLSKGVKWKTIIDAYDKAGLSEDHALTQARVARILRSSDYNFSKEEINLWSPN
jgi:DNA polymerase-1